MPGICARRGAWPGWEVAIYRRTGNRRAQKIESSVRYLDAEVDDALDIVEKIEV
jgi:hypothetical protein